MSEVGNKRAETKIWEIRGGKFVYFRIRATWRFACATEEFGLEIWCSKLWSAYVSVSFTLRDRSIYSYLYDERGVQYVVKYMM